MASATTVMNTNAHIACHLSYRCDSDMAPFAATHDLKSAYRQVPWPPGHIAIPVTGVHNVVEDMDQFHKLYGQPCGAGHVVPSLLHSSRSFPSALCSSRTTTSLAATSWWGRPSRRRTQPRPSANCAQPSASTLLVGRACEVCFPLRMVAGSAAIFARSPQSLSRTRHSGGLDGLAERSRLVPTHDEVRHGRRAAP